MGLTSARIRTFPRTAAQVMLADLSVSILAGIAIFPAVFTYGFEPAAGPSLLFITIPAVFASIPLGGVFMLLFFVLAAIAATGAMLSLLEVPVAFLNERAKMSRAAATLLTVGLLGVMRVNRRAVRQLVIRGQALWHELV